jgi:hypothetical protein
MALFSGRKERIEGKTSANGTQPKSHFQKTQYKTIHQNTVKVEGKPIVFYSTTEKKGKGLATGSSSPSPGRIPFPWRAKLQWSTHEKYGRTSVNEQQSGQDCSLKSSSAEDESRPRGHPASPP